MSEIGWVHAVFAAVAMVGGGTVCLLPKGTRWHRTLGHVYATSMLGVVATAFAIYDLTGRFGAFHFAAVVAFATLAMGLYHVLARKPRGNWIEMHAVWMSWSSIGLMAALVAETSVRVVMPVAARAMGEGAFWPIFWTCVALATLAVVGVGWWLVRTRLPGAVASVPAAVRGSDRSVDFRQEAR